MLKSKRYFVTNPYSIFHAASAVLLSKGITTSSHSGLKAMFGLHLIGTGELPIRTVIDYKEGLYDYLTIKYRQH